MPDRPSLFIGSSAEGHIVAEAVQQNLDRVCETVIWSQGVFGLGDGTLETLVDKLPQFDFAALILTPDDLVESRDRIQPSPRDNVLLEMGLCIGALGRKRTFAVYDRTSGIKLPSDLAGVTVADYQPHSTGNLRAALGAACTSIKNTIADLGPRIRESVTATIDQSTQFQIIHDLLDTAAQQFFILMHEAPTSLRFDPSPFSPGIKYGYENKNRSAGHGSLSVSKLCQQLPDAGLLNLDLRGNVTLTERGHDFADWLIRRGHKSSYFESPLGGWGTKSEGFGSLFQQSPPSANSEPATSPPA